MSLDEQYRVKTERSRFLDRIGTEQVTLVFEVPTVKIPEERANFRVSVDNILPGHDTTDIYAPCIHDSYVDNDPENREGKLVTCVYQRPSEEMILRPGRGLLKFDSYSTTKREEVAAYKKHTPTVTQPDIDPAKFASRFVILEKEDSLEIVERGLLIIRCVDWAVNEMTVYARAVEWIGKGDKQQLRTPDPGPGLTINKQLFFRLKCARVTIQRRPSNVAIVDSTFQFAMKDTTWAEDGIVDERWYAMDLNGNEIEDFDPTALPTVPYMTLKLRDYDSDVVNGYEDFTDIQSYFTWMAARAAA